MNRTANIDNILSKILLTVVLACLLSPICWADIVQPPMHEVILHNIVYSTIYIIVLILFLMFFKIIIDNSLNLLASKTGIQINRKYIYWIFPYVFIAVCLLSIFQNIPKWLLAEILLLFYFCKSFFKTVLVQNTYYSGKERYLVPIVYVLITFLPLAAHINQLKNEADELAHEYVISCNLLIESFDKAEYPNLDYDFNKSTNSNQDNFVLCKRILQQIDDNSSIKTVLDTDYEDYIVLPENKKVIIEKKHKNTYFTDLLLFNAKTNSLNNLNKPLSIMLYSLSHSNCQLLRKQLFFDAEDAAMPKNKFSGIIYNIDTNILERLPSNILSSIKLCTNAKYSMDKVAYLPDLKSIELSSDNEFIYRDEFLNKKYKPVHFKQDKEDILVIKYKNDEYLLPGLSSKDSLDLYDVKTNSIKPLAKLLNPVKNIETLPNGMIIMILSGKKDSVAVLNPNNNHISTIKTDYVIDKYLLFNDGRVLLVSNSTLLTLNLQDNKLKHLTDVNKKIKAIGIAPDTGNIILIDNKLNVINPITGVKKSFNHSSFLYEEVEMTPLVKNKILIGRRGFHSEFHYRYTYFQPTLPRDNNLLILEYNLNN